ncbi:MAG: hypothetical protein ACYDDF_02980 [Thermoplasmatota archaeon]
MAQAPDALTPTKHFRAAQLYDDSIMALRADLPQAASSPEMNAFVRASPVPELFLDDLANVYDVQAWDRATFIKAFALGSLAWWKFPAETTVDPDRLRIESTGCPLIAAAAKNTGICMLCQAFQRRVAELALGPRLRDIEFPRRVLLGHDRCTLEIQT